MTNATPKTTTETATARAQLEIALAQAWLDEKAGKPGAAELAAELEARYYGPGQVVEGELDY